MKISIKKSYFVSDNFKELMGGTIQQLRGRLSGITEEDIRNYIVDNKIKVSKAGTISSKSVQTVYDFFSTTKVRRQEDIVKSKPVFTSEDKSISLFQDDATNFLKSLPDASVDIIVTDPAYSGMNQRLKLGHGKIIGKYAEAGRNGAKWFGEFHDTEENYKAFLQECFRVLKNDRHIYLMFDSFSLLSLAPVVRDIFEVKNLICWDKANIGLGHYFRRRHEFILFASKGKRQLNSKNIPDVWKIKRVNASKYPTQKPTEVFELMLKGSVEKNFVVCDPFLGSGSSAIAALKYQCKFLGCDISDKSIAISKERIKHFLKTRIDLYQKTSALADDLAIKKLLDIV